MTVGEWQNEWEFHRVAVEQLIWEKTADTMPRLIYIWSGRADLNCRPPGPK